MQKHLLLVALAIMFFNLSFAQSDVRKPKDLVAVTKNNAQNFQKVNVFDIDLNTSRDDVELEEAVQAYNLFDLDAANLRLVGQQQPEAITLQIPTRFTSSFELELVKVNIFTPDFTVVRRSDDAVVDVNTGVHYRGIIKGDDNSIAAVSFFDGEIMGLISSAQGNLVIGKLQNRASKHIIYDDKEVIAELGLGCETPDDGIGYKAKDLTFDIENDRAPGDCIRLYMEADHDIHNDKGGVGPTTTFITGLMNEVITIYANESIEAVVSQLVVWDVPSPYSSNSSSGMLNDFQANISSINGDLGQLLSYQASGGIAAGFNGICNSNVDNSLAFSSINSTYASVPTYSWSVMVTTHEFGHLWGSRHTHACVWNGNNTAIDGCAGGTEGSCPLPGNPPQGGTIMSYCHLQSVGINFNEGFGPQPGNVIRNTVNNATCTAACGPPTCTDGIQNGNETGVDCGGPDCPPCPTCTDGVQNGNETGVDCGGIDCPPCPCNGNGVTLTIVLDNYPEETTWEIVSGGTVWASGGPYGSQPDGSTVVEAACLQNGCFNFTIFDSYGDGICCAYGQGSYVLTDDSDGSVLASGGNFGSSETTTFCVSQPAPTCTDGIQNGNETGVDCGGPDCPPCPTCTDGIQNGDETGVDCGGSCPPCGGTCTYQVIDFNNFDNSWGIWNDGGNDCRRTTRDAAYSVGGTGACVRLRDNTAASTMTTDVLNLSQYEELTVDFSYYPRSMDNSNEDFWLLVSTDGGTNFTLIEEWNRDDEFVNDTRYFDNVVIPGPFTANTLLQFRCDASGNSDWVYIDNVEVSGCLNPSLPAGNGLALGEAPATVVNPEKTIGNLNLFPNPATNELSVSLDLMKDSDVLFIVTDVQGKRLRHETMSAAKGSINRTLNVSDYNPGIYVLQVITGTERYSEKFVVIK
ncbi:MAG: zinc-dependent metalloprotease [Bacteroidota bacterium]